MLQCCGRILPEEPAAQQLCTLQEGLQAVLIVGWEKGPPKAGSRPVAAHALAAFLREQRHFFFFFVELKAHREQEGGELQAGGGPRRLGGLLAPRLLEALQGGPDDRRRIVAVYEPRVPALCRSAAHEGLDMGLIHMLMTLIVLN